MGNDNSRMGNLVAAVGSIGVPIVTDALIIPHLWHPSRFGSVPWSPPGRLVYFALYIVVMVIVSVVGSSMSSLRECNEVDVWEGIRSSVWHVAGFIVGHAFMAANVPLKSMLLTVMSWLPYASHMTSGLITALFVLFFGKAGNEAVRLAVCST